MGNGAIRLGIEEEEEVLVVILALGHDLRHAGVLLRTIGHRARAGTGDDQPANEMRKVERELLGHDPSKRPAENVNLSEPELRNDAGGNGGHAGNRFRHLAFGASDAGAVEADDAAVG